MSAWTTAVLLCAVQVTVLAAVALSFYTAFRRRWPAVAAVPQAALAGVVLVSLLAALPWRPWSWQLGVLPVPGPAPQQAAPAIPVEQRQARVPAASTTHKQPPAAQPSPLPAPGPKAATGPEPAGGLPAVAPSPGKQPATIPAAQPRRSLPAEEKKSPNELPDTGAPLVQGASGPLSSPPEELPPAKRSGRGELLLPGSSAEAEEPAAMPPWWAGVDWLAVLAILVLATAAWGLVRMLLGLWGLALLLRRSRPVEDAPLQELTRELAGRLGLRRAVSIRESDELSSAATLGWPQAVLLLSSTWRSWTREELRAVLAHELAHIRRGDFLRWLGAQLGLVLHYYHPLLHWLAARLRLEQELAADQLAVEVLQDRAGYLDALARLMLDRPARAVPLAARTFLPNGHSFMRRLEMLRQPRPGRSSLGRRMAAAALVLGVALLTCGLQPSEPAALAQRGAQGDKPPARILKGFGTFAEAPSNKEKQPRQAPSGWDSRLQGVWHVQQSGVEAGNRQMLVLPPEAQSKIKPRQLVFQDRRYYVLVDGKLVEKGTVRLLDRQETHLLLQLQQSPGMKRNFALMLFTHPENTRAYLAHQRENMPARWISILQREQGPAASAVLKTALKAASQPLLQPAEVLQPLRLLNTEHYLVSLETPYTLALTPKMLSDPKRPRDVPLPVRISTEQVCLRCHRSGWELPKLSLAYVPRDASLVEAWHAKRVARLPGARRFMQRLQQSTRGALSLLSPERAVQWTVVQLESGADLAPPPRGVVFHLDKSASVQQVEKLARTLLKQPVFREAESLKYWEGQGLQTALLPVPQFSKPCLWRSADGRTLLLASEPAALLRMLAAGPRGAERAKWVKESMLGNYLVEDLHPFAREDMELLRDVHYWFSGYSGFPGLDARDADILLYIRWGKLQNATLLPQETLLGRMGLPWQEFLGPTEDLLGGIRKLGPRVHVAATMFVQPLLQTDWALSWEPGESDANSQAKTRALAQKISALLSQVRQELRNHRAQLLQTPQPQILKQLQVLETLQQQLEQVRVSAVGPSYVLVEASPPFAALEQLEQVFPFLHAQLQKRRNTAVQRTQVANNLRQIALALHNYHQQHGRFPPAVLARYQGRKLKHPLSWRVALLPYLGHQKLFDQYRLDEPWDSPNNRKVLQQMPPVFRHPMDPPGTTVSAFYVLAGPRTVFEGSQGISVGEILDGTAQTILVVEARRNVPWTKPEDIPFDPNELPPKLGEYFPNGANVAFADGSVRFLKHNITPEVLNRLIVRNDGKTVPRGDSSR